MSYSRGSSHVIHTTINHLSAAWPRTPASFQQPWVQFQLLVSVTKSLEVSEITFPAHFLTSGSPYTAITPRTHTVRHHAAVWSKKHSGYLQVEGKGESMERWSRRVCCKKLEDRTGTHQQRASNARRGERKNWSQERVTEKWNNLLALFHSATVRVVGVLPCSDLRNNCTNLQHLLEAHEWRSASWMDWMTHTRAKGSLNPTMPQLDPLKDATEKLDKKKRSVHMRLFSPPCRWKVSFIFPPQSSPFHLQNGEVPGSNENSQRLFSEEQISKIVSWNNDNKLQTEKQTQGRWYLNTCGILWNSSWK